MKTIPNIMMSLGQVTTRAVRRTSGTLLQLVVGLMTVACVADVSQAAQVTLLADDGFGASSFNSAENWSEALAPSAGKDYFISDYRLRTPSDGGNYTFGGDSLTIETNGELAYKGTGNTGIITVNDLILSGGMIRHINGSGDLFQLAGNLNVAADSQIHAKQGPIYVNAVISGSAKVTNPGSDAYGDILIFTSPNNTYTGSIENDGRFKLSENARLNFVIGASGVNNSISGTGTVTFDGIFHFDLSGASSNIGDSWTIVDVNTLAVSFGDSFSVAGFTKHGAVWFLGSYAFDPATGMLYVQGSNCVLNANDSGFGSLRDTIAAASSGATITFCHTLSGQTILLTSGELQVFGNLTIDATSLPGGIVINGNHASRIFDFAGSSTNMLKGLTLTNGFASGAGFAGNSGGAILLFNDVMLTIADCTIISNAACADGGGIYHLSGALAITNSTFSGNFATNGGGGIFINSGTLMFNDSTLTGNSTYNDGGGIFNFLGTVIINRSALFGNSADDYGGGIYSESATLTINNSTFFGNSSDDGGGIANVGSLTINNSTFAGNSADEFGGGIANYVSLALNNSIVASNSAPGNSNIFGSFSGNGYNLTNGVPVLAPLGNYGGPTQTMPPLPGSLAIDAGDNLVTNTYTTDQRGLPRLVGEAVDIGAVEYNPTEALPLFRNEMISGVGWGVNANNSDYAATFGYDYSADDIPEAPNSRGGDVATTGVKLEANITSGLGSIFTLYPIGQHFTGDYQLRFDAWMNYEVDVFTGTVELIGGGIGYDNTSADIGSGAQILATGDGGSSLDWRAFADGAFLGSTDMIAGSCNASDPYYSDFLPGVPPPAGQAQSSFSPGAAGSLGFQWVTFEINSVDGVADVYIEKPDGERLLIVAINANGGWPYTTDGNIGLVYADFIASVARRPDLTFGLIDNVEVNVAPKPSTIRLVLNTNDSGLGSLRQAIADAANGAIITFTNTLSGQTILLTNGQLLVGKNLTIDASDLPEGIVIDGNASSRIFEFAESTTNTLTGLTLTNGRASGGIPAGCGGAILLNGSVKLTIADSTIVSNAASQYGGGIFSSYGYVVVSNSSLSGNSASWGGGIMCQHGMNLVNHSTIWNNSALNFGGGIVSAYAFLMLSNSTLSGNSAPYGGGIYSDHSTNTLNESTLNGNSASDGGGGILSSSYSINILNNSTLSGNSASDGGGIYCSRSTNGLNNSTVSGNTAFYGGGIYSDYSTNALNNSTVSGNSAFRGGGIYSGSSTNTLNNTIVAGNSATNSYPNVFGSLTGSHNLTNGNPMLAPLGNYAGPTQTMPPLPGSPAIDAGLDTGSLPATDQRGYARVVNGTVDIGAVEFRGASDVVIQSDTFGDLFAGVTGDGILDITSAAVSHTVSNITFRIFLAGDPTATDWGKYMVAIHSESGGDTTGNPWLRPIGMDVGMNCWLGAWVNYGSGVQAWHYTDGAWTLVGGSVPNGGDPQVPELTITKDSQSVTITSPLWLLGLSLGQTIQFDIYTSGSSGTDGAIDALANPAQTVADWSQYYNSGTNLYTYTLTFIGPPALTINFDPQLSSIRIAWPSPSTGWYLLQCTDLTTPNWVVPSETVTDNGTEKFIIVNPSAGNRFFRLFKL